MRLHPKRFGPRILSFEWEARRLASQQATPVITVNGAVANIRVLMCAEDRHTENLCTGKFTQVSIHPFAT